MDSQPIPWRYPVRTTPRHLQSEVNINKTVMSNFPSFTDSYWKSSPFSVVGIDKSLFLLGAAFFHWLNLNPSEQIGGVLVQRARGHGWQAWKGHSGPCPVITVRSPNE